MEFCKLHRAFQSLYKFACCKLSRQDVQFAVQYEHIQQVVWRKDIKRREGKSSTEYSDGMMPYYPVNEERNNTLILQYKLLMVKDKDVIFGGRLAEYKYYDMDVIIEKTIKEWKSKE